MKNRTSTPAHATRRLLVSLSAGLLVASAACLEPTQIKLMLYTDVPYQPGRSVAIAVSKSIITDATVPSTTTDQAWGADGAIGSLVLLPADDRDEAVSVRAVLGVGRDPSTCSKDDAAGCIFARRRLAFVPHEPLTLPITLYAVCEGVPCDEQSTCSALGTCVPVDLDPQACAEGKLCDVPTGDASVDTSQPSSSSGGGGTLEDAPTSSSSSSSSSSSGSVVPSCDPTDVTVTSGQFFSFGNTNSSADVVSGGGVFQITLPSADRVCTLERTLNTPNPACPLHFVLDLASLSIDANNQTVWVMSIQRNDAPEVRVEVSRNASGAYAVSVLGGGNRAWAAPSGGLLELSVPLVPGAEAAMLRVDAAEVPLAASTIPSAPVSQVTLGFGLTGAASVARYRTVRYFFGPR